MNFHSCLFIFILKETKNFIFSLPVLLFHEERKNSELVGYVKLEKSEKL